MLPAAMVWLKTTAGGICSVRCATSGEIGGESL
jgi:hypothetical protein